MNWVPQGRLSPWWDPGRFPPPLIDLSSFRLEALSLGSAKPGLGGGEPGHSVGVG